MSKKLIKSFEEACKAQGLDPKKVLPDVSAMPEQDQKAIIALAKMCIIQRSLNGDWKADWSDGSQPKFYPWFDVNPDDNGPSGFGLSYYCYDYAYSCSSLGARLYYKDRETAKYAGTQFTELYADMILIPR